MTQIPTWSGGPASPPTGRAAPGTTIGGRYSLRSPVGNGGMGTVWRATDTLLRRDVAVKEVVLPPGLAPSDRDALYERTLREARAAAAIQHPAVVQVYDVVTEGGRPWIVMELLDARSLADMVIEDGPVAPRAVAKIGIALLGALEVAHAIGVLHRDVKPANVLICTDGRCVLTDFGVARMPTDVQLTTPGMVLGSPHFISPERAMGQEFGPPSDLFSLGVTLYTAVEGRPPFDKGDPIETMHAVVEDPPATPQRSGPLTGVLMGLLEKDPARRMDVHRARANLRELLAGPLTSTATAVNSVTDPYAVVPVPRPTTPPAIAAEPKPSGQIGGRAMIGPDESLTDRLAALRRGERPQAEKAAAGAAALDETSADALAGPLHTPTGAMSGPGTPEATQRISPDATVRLGAGAGADATQAVPATYGRTVDATQPVYGGGNQWSVPGTGQAWTTPATAPAAGGAGTLGTAKGLLGRVKAWPRKVQLAAAGGLAVVLLVSVIALTSGGDDAPPPIVGTLPTTSAAAAPEMQERTVKGVTIQVPKGWQQQTGGLYVDYVDPEDEGRKVRVIAEKWGGTSISWAEFASRNLKSKTANSKTCPAPYTELSVSEQPLAGQTAGQLEYTCGEGETMRHGIWRGLVKDGKVYSFYLSTTDARFAESKPIFDAMVDSFQLTAAN
ncbi:serine/threonine-protein kinase [Micromonospora sp. WMMA1949]|uniref:serine/threonine-protein kinase n=1 Tax=unclassified Micromonospora TaxID=2617518 RepID=UPI0022B66B9D|nr:MULTISPECIES: serine/threonine-protein kinase [unclassified Micromonospora]MCZ7425787.1 serine/threonine-protein kinase [Micromonospora sp. WMMA1949]WBC10329.1 serine/threonine-protein kinase [Micromonospora sp. WMMA1947]